MTPSCISDPIKYTFLAQHKILHQIKPKNIKIGKLLHMEVKKNPKIRMAPDRICF
jgi:hypothetical protein